MNIVALVNLRTYCREELTRLNTSERSLQLRKILADVEARLILEELNYGKTWDLEDAFDGDENLKMPFMEMKNAKKTHS